MSSTSEDRPASVPLPRGVWVAAVVVFAGVLVFGPRYGLFRDEFYYLVCADHLAWGYVDHPPLSIAVLALVKALLGDSIHAVRLVPALLGGALVFLAALLARTLGGGRWACTLAATAVAAVPQFLGQAGYYSMNVFDLVLWAWAALVVARLRPDERRWQPFALLGLVLGLGLLNKYSMLFFGVGLAVALLATPLRRLLLTPGPWLAAGIAFLLFLPHLVWQYANGFPTREFIENATRHKNVALSPLQFLLAQIPDMNPFTLPLWAAGLGFLLVGRRVRPQRALGIIFVTAFVVLALQHSKPYYLGPAYLPLFAAGAVLFEGWRSPAGRRAVIGVLVVSGLLVAPFAVPVLPVGAFIAYQKAAGMSPQAGERHQQGALPQFFADRFGWGELTLSVHEAWRGLSAEDQARTIIVTSNYGQAGALRYLGRAYGLPPAASQHNSFYFWGPGREDAEVIIAVGIPEDDLRNAFTSVEVVQRWSSPYAMPYEQRAPIAICRGLKLPLDEAWKRGRHFI